MREDPVEVVARAIAAADGQDADVLVSTYNGRQRLHDYRRFARAAIKALREPTMDQVSFGTAALAARNSEYRPWAADLRRAYTAMLDAALARPPEET